LKTVASYFVFLIVLFSSITVWSQDQQYIDSLQNVLQSADNDTTRIIVLHELFNEYEYEHLETAKEYLDQSFELAKKQKDQKWLADTYLHFGWFYDDINDRANAIKSQFKSLEISKSIEDEMRIALANFNIANTYEDVEKIEQCLPYYFSALDIFIALKESRYIGMTYNNLGIAYKGINDYEKALEYFEKSLKVKRKRNDFTGIANSYGNIATTYENMGNYEKAIEYYNKTVEIDLEQDNAAGAAFSFNNLAFVYLHLKQYEKALYFAKTSVNLAKHIFDIETKRDAHQAYAQSAEKMNLPAEALEQYKLYQEYSDSVNMYQNAADVEQWELERSFAQKQVADSLKQIQIDLKKAEKLKRQELETASQKKLTYIFSGGFLLMLILAFVVFNAYKNKRKANQIISQQKEEVEHQKELVEEKHKEITDSINYAKRIQTAILTSDEYWKQISPEHFLLFLPKDVVSGDFYWAYHSPENLSIWVAADCTGHGVPGAFMSMIGNSFINEIVVENKVRDSAKILNQLRDKIVKALEQKNVDTEQKDGMDLALCIWDKSTNQLQYSGANNSLWLIRNGELSEYKADKQPVGKYTDEKPFTSQQIQLEKGDVVYTFSDGFPDQFGGPKGKKYKYKQFKELLLSIQDKKMSEQQEIISKEFYLWKGELEQIDDVCIIGIKV
jgi:serine phosphatase RsbU (regulator of sigma subunit)